MKARHTTDAIPQRASAGIISEGNGGLKWRTNFSKTSSERNVHALRLFFSSSLPPLFFLFFFFPHSPSPFFLPLCFVSDMKPLFYQINISQNKSQDNFKLVREAEGGGGGERFLVEFFYAVSEVEFLSVLLLHSFSASVVSSSPSCSRLQLMRSS